MSTNLKGVERLLFELKDRHCNVEGPIQVGPDTYVLWKNYTVVCGPYVGKVVTIGIKAPGDFPETPPAGFIVSPRLAPNGPFCINDNFSPVPPGEWQYWSRQVTGWKQADAGKRLTMWVRTAFANYGKDR